MKKSVNIISHIDVEFKLTSLKNISLFKKRIWSSSGYTNECQENIQQGFTFTEEFEHLTFPDYIVPVIHGEYFLIRKDLYENILSNKNWILQVSNNPFQDYDNQDFVFFKYEFVSNKFTKFEK